MSIGNASQWDIVLYIGEDGRQNFRTHATRYIFAARWTRDPALYEEIIPQEGRGTFWRMSGETLRLMEEAKAQVRMRTLELTHAE